MKHVSEVSEGVTILPALLQMKHKMGVKTRQTKKYKVRLNIDGSMMVHQKHHEQTYAPVATCNSIRTLLIQDLLNK